MIVYKTTNIINNKIYVGKCEKTNNNYIGSGKYLKQDIIKYGKDNFHRIIIDCGSNRAELNEKEQFWIKFYNARNPEIGYNICKGGNGGAVKGHKVSEKTKEKIGKANSISHKGIHLSEKTKEKIKISLSGKTHSLERRLNESISHKGKTSPNKGKVLGPLAAIKAWKTRRLKNS